MTTIAVGAQAPSALGIQVASSPRPSGRARIGNQRAEVGLAHPVVGIASTQSGNGDWLVASDGGIFSFGDARFMGSTGAVGLNQPIVGMAATPSGNGYWLVASDGGIFSFGDATFHGSTGAIRLNRPIVGMAPTPSGHGYWFVADDGGVFSFGDAAFAGSATASALAAPIVSMAASAGGHGYWLAGSDGSVYALGGAAPLGSATGLLGQIVVGVAAAPSGQNLWLAGHDGISLGLPSRAAAAVAGSTSHSWLVTNPDGSPIRWDPCHPLHYVTNLSMAPATAAADVSGALDRISAVTGISFVDDGTTNEVPVVNRAVSQPARYGSGWAPILIAWSDPSLSNLLPGGSILGEGGATWASAGVGASVFVTGVAVVDSGATSGLSAGYGAGLTFGALLLHELGHVVGLGHTPDTAQIMYPDLISRPLSGYGAGDLAGLRHLGVGAGCLSTPTM